MGRQLFDVIYFNRRSTRCRIVPVAFTVILSVGKADRILVMVVSAGDLVIVRLNGVISLQQCT